MRPRHLVLAPDDAALNLALEEFLLRTLPAGHPGLFLVWRNAPSIIVGRYQASEDEADLISARREGVPIIRRMTGGGAVMHDPGTLCFSFLHAGAGPESGPGLAPESGSEPGPATGQAPGLAAMFAATLAPVLLALSDLGVEARLTGRNDIEVAGRKVAGCAFTRIRGACLCHGVLLLSADLERMARLLTPDAAKAHGRAAGRAVASVRARVGNLAALVSPAPEPARLCAALLARCAPEPERLGREKAAFVSAGADLLAQRKYRNPEWNFGTVAPWTERRRARFPWGGVELRLRVAAGRIRAARVCGDFFTAVARMPDAEAAGEPAPGPACGAGIASLERRLAGCRAEAAAVEAALADVPWNDLFAGCDPRAMRDFFAGRPSG